MVTRHYSTEEDIQRNYYNKIAEEYDRSYFNPGALKYRAFVYEKLLSGLNVENSRVLDAMCGGGEASAWFNSRGCQTIGLDISEKCCSIYKSRYPNSEAHSCSILATDFESNYFDIVVTDSLHHLHPHLKLGLTEIRRILKPGGLFVFWEPNRNSLVDLARRLWYRLDPRYFMPNERAISISEITTAKGFETVSTCFGGGIGYLLICTSMALRMNGVIPEPLEKILLLLERCSMWPPYRFFTMWVGGVIRKTG